MSRRNNRRQIAVAAAFALIAFLPVNALAAAVPSEEICDAAGDYALGVENYPEAVRLHEEIVRQHPDNALAHYHLGFAYGMLNESDNELREYSIAERLGLHLWDLYLNLGLALMEDGNLDEAALTLRHSVALGPSHPESHFNLGLAYERKGRLRDAREEMVDAIALEPSPDARNELALIDVELGDRGQALNILNGLVRDQPQYETARKNLLILKTEIARDGEMHRRRRKDSLIASSR